ncbi:hypothetical protein [Streptomyces sp. WAC08241]|uniref:hypothetical protein n=1 Tax=Streptomyces sp. WAC08241 TaxID=2487421 RepID=UPI000F789287|nr:hypothetical protein [Streptomyces sp. WAC08241]RSS36735.1 hypothetical protein EF906_24585 [Streptomyces sp. WAC08241]
MKRCSYCGQPITGQAKPIPDGAATGAHAPAYWHADPGECGPREERPTGMDETGRLHAYLTRAGRER